MSIREVDHVLPDTVNASRYAKQHKIFQAIYPALKPIYGLL